MSTRIALIWAFSERYANLVVTLAASMIVARLLTPAEIGVFSLCAASMAMAGAIRDFGVSEYIIQEKELNDARLRNAFAVAFVTAWPLGLVIFMARGQLATYYEQPELASLLSVLTLNFLLLPFATPAFALLNREMAFRTIFVIQSASTMAQAGSSVFLAWRGFGPFSLAWASVIGAITQIAMVTLLRPRNSFLMPNFRGASKIFRFGTYQMLARMVETITNNAHEFIIARQFGFAEVGLFSRAKGLSDMFHKNVTIAITSVATPAMASAHRASQPLKTSFANATAIFTSISWTFFSYAALAAPEIVRFMLGPQWDRAGPIAGTLAVAMLPSGLFALAPSVFSAMGKVELRMRISMKSMAVHLAVLAIAANFGFQAIAQAWFFSSLVIAFLFAASLRKLLDTSLKELFGPSLPSVYVAACSAACQFAVIHWMRAANMHFLSVLAASALTAGLSWYLAVRIFNHPVQTEIHRVASGIRSRLPQRG